MVFEPNFTKVVSSVRKNIGSTQSVVELKLPTDENNISKVYSVGAKSNITSSDINGRDVSFVGLVDFQAVFESMGVSALDYTAEFKDRFVADEPLDGELIVSSNVIDVNCSIVSGGIRVVAIIEVCFDLISSQEINVLTSVNDDNVHTSTKDLEYTTYVGKAYEKFEVSGELELSGATNVLMVTPCASLINVEPRDNYLIVNGTLNLDICYKIGEEIDDIATKYHSIDFSWEVALDGMTENSFVQSEIAILTNEIKVSTVVEDGVANMSVNVPVVYGGYVFNKNTIVAIDDLYLEGHYLSVTCENFKTISSGKTLAFKDNVSGTASVSDTAPFIDNVLGVCTNNLVVASTRIESGRLCIEGIANSTVVYFTKETATLTSVQVEMPFSVEQKVMSGCVALVSICLENISARSKRGKEIEVSAELIVYSDIYDTEERCVISQVVFGEEKKKDDCSLYIYVVKPGQTIWDVAKDVSVSQDLILEQNADVELPLRGGERLVVYRPNIMQF